MTTTDIGPTAADNAPQSPATAAASPAAAVDDRPRTLSARTLDDTMSLVGAAAGSLGLVWLTYSQILGWSGVLGFLVVWYLSMLALYAGVTALTNPKIVVIDRLAMACVWAGAIVVGFALATTLVYTLWQGLDALQHMNFYRHDMAGVAPTDPLNQGGIFHAMLGSFIEVGIAVIVALPLGIGTAVYITEVPGRGGRVVRTIVEAMTALPDILAGLFIYVTLIIGLGVERSGFAAAMALAVMMTPIIARSAEVQLRVVPGGLREAGLALGASQWRTVRNVVLPTAKAGLATALILGVARAVGETAPVLITSGASTFTNADPLHNPMNSLPLYILFAVRSGQPLYIVRGFGAAAVLLTIVLILFVFTRFLARDRFGRARPRDPLLRTR
jgi:phosphate transport system permease protein